MATSSSADDRQTSIKKGIIKKAWTDKTYRTQLLNDPVTVCKTAGLSIPESATNEVSKDSNVSFKLPEAPSNYMSMNSLEQDTAVARAVSTTPEMF